MDLFLFVFSVLILSFMTLKRCGQAALDGLCKGLWAAKDSQKVQIQGHMKKEATQVGKEYIMKGEKSSRPVLGTVFCCSKYPWKSLQGPSLLEHFLHIFRKESNHPFHFILTMSKLRLPGYLQNHLFHLPKNQMPINYTNVKLAW